MPRRYFETHYRFISQNSNDPAVAGKQGKIFTEDGIPDSLFDDCESLEYLSTFVNGLTVLKARWFQNTQNIESLVVFLNGISAFGPSNPLTIEEGVFDNLPNLIDFSMYSSDLFGYSGVPSALDPTKFVNNEKLLGVLDGSQFLLAPKDFRALVGLGDVDPLGIEPEVRPLPTSED